MEGELGELPKRRFVHRVGGQSLSTNKTKWQGVGNYVFC